MVASFDELARGRGDVSKHTSMKARKMWTGRMSTQSKFFNPIKKPVIHGYVPSPQPAPRYSTMQLLKEIETLGDKAEAWLAEAKKFDDRAARQAELGSQKQAVAAEAAVHDDRGAMKLTQGALAVAQEVSSSALAWRAAGLRKRAAQAKGAVEAKRIADALEEALKEEMTSNVDVQLGVLLDKRKVRMAI